MPSTITLLVATAGAALCAVAAVSEAGSPRIHSTAAPDSRSIIDGLAKPIARWEMPQELHELSGLAVNSAGEVLAHDDEKGVVFVLDPSNGKVLRSLLLGAPPPRDDFEGIAVAGDRIFLMTSTGRLYETRESRNGMLPKVSITETGFGQLCELEGLAHDPTTHDLLVGCKVPYSKQLRGRVTVLRWSLDRDAPSAPIIVSRGVAGASKPRGSSHFSTSALEYDPKSSHILLVAGIEQSLLEITRDGYITANRPLSKSNHRQPESLTFLGDSLILIGDEGASGRATISVYKRDQ